MSENKRGPFKRWTETEEQTLLENIDTILNETKEGSLIGMNTPTIQQLSALFGRTEAAVHHKARILAVKLGKIPTTSKQIAQIAKSDSRARKSNQVVQLEIPAETADDSLDAVMRLVYGKVDYDTFLEIRKQMKSGNHE